MEIRGFEFEPARLRVQTGDTIVWINRDLVPHTASSETARWDSGRIGRDGSWEWVVEGPPGEIPYDCTFHPTMRGMVVVEGGG